MKSFNDCIIEYREQIEKGYIKEAYRGLIGYIMDLRLIFKNKYSDYSVSGSIYQGYMDMTYFALFPESLKDKKLKIAVVFIYDTFRFEVWLAGYNKQVQTKYWKLFKESNWTKYSIPPTTKGADSILEFVLIDNPDFSDKDALNVEIERGTLNFINDITTFLSKH